MAVRPVLLRLLAALLAAYHVGVPAVAGLVESRPFALTLSERAAALTGVPEGPHAMGHTEECALCLLGTLHSVVPPSPPAIAAATLAAWPPRRHWLARPDGGDESALRSRAPPA